LRFVLSTAPWTGGIATLLSDRALERRFRRIESFLSSVSDRVDEIANAGHTVDDLMVESDEFLTVFEWAMDEAVKTDDEIKLEYLRNFLVSSALTVRPDSSVRRMFSSYVSRLAGSHLVALVGIAKAQADIAESDRLGRHEIRGRVPVTADFVAAMFDPVSSRLAVAVCVDLCGMGLLVDWADLAEGGRRQRGFSVTETGRLFTRFLESSWTTELV
jgi:urease gamma subunit